MSAILMAGSRSGRAPHCSLALIEEDPVDFGFLPVQAAPPDIVVDIRSALLSLT
jgi:hypothetical protein